jgi:hypothetical protein
MPRTMAATKPKDMAMAAICSRVWSSILLSSFGVRSRRASFDDVEDIGFG